MFPPRFPSLPHSFHDASIGVISLVVSIYVFGVLGRNDVRVLTLISIGVVAGLHQEVGAVAFAGFRVRTFSEDFGAFEGNVLRLKQCNSPRCVHARGFLWQPVCCRPELPTHRT